MAPMDAGSASFALNATVPPIFTLRREFDKARSGAVFVRKHGLTVPADASDMDALQARLVAAPPPTALEVALTGDVPISWFDGAAAPASLEAWVAERAETMVAAARATENRRLGPGPRRQSGQQARWRQWPRTSPPNSPP